MTQYSGPTANLKGTARRSGRAMVVLINGEMRGEVVACEWGRTAEQIAVQIPGKWQDEMKPGGETAAGTFRYQDVDDHWRLLVWRFFKARRSGDRTSASFPEFDLIQKIDDIGAPMATRWAILGCQFFQLDGGASQDDSLLVRDVPFSYREEVPLDAFEYGSNGLILTQESVA
jgi:hypothetical protein